MSEKKRSVLIVDDEYHIARLIFRLINWEEMNLECMDVLYNGEAALQTVLEKKPDIVITDVKMPKVNGLDLIKVSRDNGIDASFIIVSGYKEFEYARRALAYDVEDYILKPINAKELNDALRRICSKMDSHDRETTIKEKLHEEVVKSKNIIKRDFLKNIISQSEERGMSEASDISEEVAGSLSGDLYRGIDIKLDCLDRNKMDPKQDKLTVERVKELVETILSEIMDEVLICERDTLHIYCLFNYDKEKSKSVRNYISELLLKIKD